MPTTRGDRLFIGLLGAAYIHLAWLGLSGLPLWCGSIVALIWLAIVMRWG
jgi:predicted small integral membrane protein